VRIARFTTGDDPLYGVVTGDLDEHGELSEDATIVTLAGDPMYAGVKPLDEQHRFADVRLLAPVIPRSKVVAIGRNYAAHAAELGNEVPERPLIFLKPSTSVIGTQDVIRLPADSEQVEHEAELAVIIGRVVKDVPRDRAMEVIFGYTCGNDVTARDQQRTDGQWTRAKGYDSFCPIGPWIGTTFDPAAARVRCLVNDRTTQDGDTQNMIFDVATLVSYVSHVMTLMPGDVLLTGTPDGVGRIADGDTVRVAIDGIGELVNPVRAKG